MEAPVIGDEVTVRAGGKPQHGRPLARGRARNVATPASGAALTQLNATVFQFENVHRVRYELGDSCDAFAAWLAAACELARP